MVETAPVLAMRDDGGAVLVYEDWGLNTTRSTLVLVLNAGNLAIPTTPGAYEWHYTYDGLGRVKEACDLWTGSACDGDAWTYEYDGAGNLLQLDRWDAAAEQVETARFVYNGANQIACLDGNANQQCGDPEDVAYTYDSYGNLTGDGVNTYTYDDAMRLTSVGDGLTTTTYTYNGDGDRVSQTVNDGGGDVTTTYVLDTATPLTMVLAETTGTDPTIYYLHGLGLVAQSDGTDTEYFAYDGLGSVRQVADSSASRHPLPARGSQSGMPCTHPLHTPALGRRYHPVRDQRYFTPPMVRPLTICFWKNR